MLKKAFVVNVENAGEWISTKESVKDVQLR